MLNINVDLPANGRHDVTAARHAAEGPFCMCQLLHFCAFPLNLHFDLEPDYVIREPIKQHFQQYLAVRKYCRLFTRVEYISRRTIRHSAHSNEWGHKCQKIPETAPSLEVRGPQSNISMPGPTQLTTPKDSSVAVRTSTQLRNGLNKSRPHDCMTAQGPHSSLGVRRVRSAG